MSSVSLFETDASGKIFYSLDMAIRLYRQFAHERLAEKGIGLTVDQCLVLKALNDHPLLRQQEIAALTFKDHASLTRIVELLVQKEMLVREIHKEDRRRFSLTVTKKGSQLLKTMQPIIDDNRKAALKGLTKKQQSELQAMLDLLIANCKV